MSRKRDISHVSEFDATQLPPAPAHRVPVPPSPYQLPGQQLAPSSLLDAANSLEQQQQYRPPSSSASGSGLDLGEQRQMQNFAAAAIQANSNRAGGAGGPAAGPSSSGANANAAGGAAGGASEFVKKLFNILEDREYDDVVSWGAQGDSFVVKDMNAFTTVILPQHFKHVRSHCWSLIASKADASAWPVQLCQLCAPAQQVRLPQGAHTHPPTRDQSIASSQTSCYC